MYFVPAERLEEALKILQACDESLSTDAAFQVQTPHVLVAFQGGRASLLL